MARNKTWWGGTAIQGESIAARRARARIRFEKKPDHGPCLDWAAAAKLRTACVDVGFLSFMNEPSSHCAIPFHSSVAGCSRWVTGACREKSSVKLWSNSAEHECLSEVLQVARWLKCGRFTVVHYLAVRVGVEPPQTPDAQSARAARTQRMSNLSNGAAC
jgi:hypothetical protein